MAALNPFMLGVSNVTVEHYSITRVLGEVTRTLDSSETISASIQPSNGRDTLPNLPEGLRVSEVKWMFTGCELRTIRVATQEPEDIIVYKGRRYKIFSVSDWSDHIAPTAHYSYLITQIGADEQEVG